MLFWLLVMSSMDVPMVCKNVYPSKLSGLMRLIKISE